MQRPQALLKKHSMLGVSPVEIESAMHEKVKQYFASTPESRRKILQVIHTLIVEAFPEVTLDMKYKMPTYHQADGWVAIANQKNYVSLYTCGYHHIKDFKERHPAIKTGKGCINFKETDVLPKNDLKQVISHAMLQVK